MTSAWLRSSRAVIELGIATQRIPARLAAATPCGESSMAMASIRIDAEAFEDGEVEIRLGLGVSDVVAAPHAVEAVENAQAHEDGP